MDFESLKTAVGFPEYYREEARIPRVRMFARAMCAGSRDLR
jgi:hypothetical protein